jgi:succinate dehydrogenase / fumarate reductase cytochrome b subunit
MTDKGAKMAGTGTNSRPLSPHLQIYRLPLTARMSILHRFTGMGMAVTLVLLVWWFLAAATGSSYFAFVDGLLTSWICKLVLVISLWGFWYHFFNGVRHLRWDMVKGLGLGESHRTGLYVIVLSVLLTVFTLWAAL